MFVMLELADHGGIEQKEWKLNGSELQQDEVKTPLPGQAPTKLSDRDAFGRFPKFDPDKETQEFVVHTQVAQQNLVPNIWGL